MDEKKILGWFLLLTLALIVYSVAHGSSLPELADVEGSYRSKSAPLPIIKEDVIFDDALMSKMAKNNITQEQLSFIVKHGFKYHTPKGNISLRHCPMSNVAVIYDEDNKEIKNVLYGANMEWMEKWLASRDKYRRKNGK